MSRSPTITRLTSLAQESGACRWPSTSKIAIVEMKHLLPALLLAGLGGHAVGLSEVTPADPPRLFLLGTAGGRIPRQEIGRASGRDSVCLSVWIAVGDVPVKQTNTLTEIRERRTHNNISN